MNQEYDVIAAGHLALDITPTIPVSAGSSINEIFRPGKLVNVDAAVIGTGGSVSNTGISLKLLGLRVGFIAKVGDDDFGRLALDRLREKGNADGISVSKGQITSYTIVLTSPAFDRMFLHCPGANDLFTSADINPDVLQRARHFHLGYPPLMRSMYVNDGAEIEKVFKKAKDQGLTTSLDMSLPDPASESGQVSWKTVFKRVLPYVDILLPSVEEALFAIDRERFLKMKEETGGAELIDHLKPEDYSEISSELLSMGARMTSLKAGHRGFYFRTADAAALENMGRAKPGSIENWANREVWCPAYRVEKFASATGSGDASIAGFLAAFLKGYSVEESLRSGNCVGYQNLHALDTLSGIKDWDYTTKLLQSGALEPMDPKLDSAGWRWDEAKQVYLGPNDRGNR